ncbi:MAG: PEP-CTERM sorting domain-containing protein [Cyanobacteria bacterium CRU_2_1]|nr:PEP-CTERM sorting domain-containing protein [Cyanobacteria bacterium RU_5_0]NJR61240.1 PEP-CTERM sorting domain-containing protein [Cyanobacteria bacterium CRU_2_1]
MKLASNIAQKILWATVPLVTVSTIAALPSQAATFSRSSANAFVGNFSHDPYDTGTFTNTFTQTFATSGEVTAQADAEAFFTTESVSSSATGFNFSTSESFGTGTNFFGAANSFSSIIGQFQIAKGETFSFDFLSTLELETSVDDPQTETAFAASDIQFELFDSVSGITLDSFGLFGNLTSPGTWNSLGIESSDSISLADVSKILLSNETESVAFAGILGTYSRTFDSSVDLTLREFKANKASVEAVPEPSEIMGTIVALGLLLGSGRLRMKAKKNASKVLPSVE